MTTGRPAPRGRSFHIRAESSYRMLALDCGHSDPWRPHRPEPTTRQVDGYRNAIAHLDSLGLTAAPLLPEMRLLWQRGGADRRMAQTVAQRWEVAA